MREAAAAEGKRVPILLDLQGLKIRTGRCRGGDAGSVCARQRCRCSSPNPVRPRPEQIGIDYAESARDLEPGSRMLIADGLIELLVDKSSGTTLIADVSRGGLLLGRQGVTLPGAPIRAEH